MKKLARIAYLYWPSLLAGVLAGLIAGLLIEFL